MEAFNGRVRDRVLSDARWKKLQVQSHKSVCFIVREPYMLSKFLIIIATESALLCGMSHLL
jgi:hypothetical protein